MRHRWTVLLAVTVATAATAGPASAQDARGAWRVEGEAIYEARDRFATWSGRAPLEDAELRFDPTEPAALEMTARVRPEAFDSGNPLRDLNARRTVFDVAEHPVATARVAADAGAGPPRSEPDGWTVPIEVELTLHGTSVRYAAVARIARDGADWTGTAVLTLSLEDHGMRRPRLFGILTEDSVRLEVRVRARPVP